MGLKKITDDAQMDLQPILELTEHTLKSILLRVRR